MARKKSRAPDSEASRRWTEFKEACSSKRATKEVSPRQNSGSPSPSSITPPSLPIVSDWGSGGTDSQQLEAGAGTETRSEVIGGEKARDATVFSEAKAPAPAIGRKTHQEPAEATSSTDWETGSSSSSVDIIEEFRRIIETNNGTESAETSPVLTGPLKPKTFDPQAYGLRTRVEAGYDFATVRHHRKVRCHQCGHVHVRPDLVCKDRDAVYQRLLHGGHAGYRW